MKDSTWKDYEVLNYFCMVCGSNTNNAKTALKLFRQIEHEKYKSCAIWKALQAGLFTPYICDMVYKFVS